MENIIKYWVVELTTQNPSADDSWNFRDLEQANAFATRKQASCDTNPEIYGRSSVRLYERSLVFCDD